MELTFLFAFDAGLLATFDIEADTKGGDLPRLEDLLE